jgi:hypothetical protein
MASLTSEWSSVLLMVGALFVYGLRRWRKIIASDRFAV